MDNTEYIMLKDIMQELGISRNTAYRLVHERGLRYTKIGRLMKIRKSDFDDWMRKNTVGGDDE